MKRGRPLTRKTPLRRSPIRRGKVKSAYRLRPRDIGYMLEVKRLPCVVRSWGTVLDVVFVSRMPTPTTCEGRVEADHAGTRAFGRKSADDTVISLCRKHHRERTDYSGTFRGWTKADMRGWCDWAIGRTQAEVAQMMEARNG
jgi:hypothetical protein